MTEVERHEGIVPADSAGKRLDQALAEMFPDFSRSRLKTWIDAGLVEVDGARRRPRDRLSGGEKIVVCAQPEPATVVRPEAIPLDIVYSDEDVLVIDKPPGLVVHPGAGNPTGTLQNALLHYDEGLAVLPRGGIVHRLDKDTGGLMVVARSLRAHTALVRMISLRAVTREYLALCQGAIISGGTVDAPIGRHPVDRVRMAVVPAGKPAISHYRVTERYAAHTLVTVRLETGRTHQIRVHMQNIGYPLTGDPLYGGRLQLPGDISDTLRQRLRDFRRQALHAVRLELHHPVTGELHRWRSPPAADFALLLEALRGG